jgi:hypothetical protein
MCSISYEIVGTLTNQSKIDCPTARRKTKDVDRRDEVGGGVVSFWTKLDHGPRKLAQLGESPRMSKLLGRKGIRKRSRKLNTLKSDSQAYDEGSIPFTRSTNGQF